MREAQRKLRNHKSCCTCSQHLHGGRRSLAAILCRQPETVSSIQMQVEAVVERECLVPILALEPRAALTLKAVPIPPYARNVMCPPVIPCDFLRCGTGQCAGKAA